ncbi:MAG: hypothetical protein ABSD57_08015 [Verrucomicrobiota bacterium]|jgi:hypothetical protein
MAVATLKSLHTYLRLLENSSELKRRMPTSSTPRTLKEGLYEISKLVGIDNVAFKDPQNIAAVIGPQRFVMIWGEPSITEHVARVFDSSKVLMTVLIDPLRFEKTASGQLGPTTGTAQQQTAAKTLSASWAQLKAESSGAQAQLNPEPETALESLKPLLAGNTALTCKLFRALFEHMLGFVSPSSAQQGSATLVNELTGSKEHSRSFLSTAMFILGAEVDYDNLTSFMMEQGLFGIPIFEHLLQNQDYCEAYYAFRRLERAFIGSPAEEEKQLRNRIDKLNAQFEGKPCDEKMFEAGEQDKARVDAHLAAVDVLEVMALTPLSISLNHSIAAASSNSVRSMKIIARHFERFADGEETKEQANKEIADHLLAFARQFSADNKAASPP